MSVEGLLAHLFFGDLAPGIAFEWNGQQMERPVEFDTSTEAGGAEVNLGVPLAEIGSFPVYLKFSGRTLVGDFEEHRDVIWAQGTVNNVVNQYNTLIYSPQGNAGPSGGGLNVNAAFGSDIWNASFDADYSEQLILLGLATKFDAFNGPAGPVKIIPKISGLYGRVSADTCFQGTTANQLADPVRFSNCNDYDIDRWGLEASVGFRIPVYEREGGVKIGVFANLQGRYIYNDADLDARTVITGNGGAINIDESQSASDSFGDFGGVVGGGIYVNNGPVSIRAGLELETWQVVEPIYEFGQVVDLDTVSRDSIAGTVSMRFRFGNY